MHGSDTTYLAQILVSAFLAILFLQSGIDKIFDRQGNLQWLSGHFAKSPLAKMLPFLFGILTLIEVLAGALSAVGFLLLMVSREPAVAFYGAIVSAIAVLCLFFGQRMAKEYAGAAILVPYFLLTLVAIYVLGF